MHYQMSYCETKLIAYFTVKVDVNKEPAHRVHVKL